MGETTIRQPHPLARKTVSGAWNVRHTTYHQDLPERVTIVRPRHPFEGKSLAVVGAMHRKGRLTLTLIFPDGTKSLIPADWTDLAPTGPPRGVIGAKQIATRDSLEALIHASALVDALLGRLAETRSEEHTSELQSRLHLVCRLLLEKKKKTKTHNEYDHSTRTRSEYRILSNNY